MRAWRVRSAGPIASRRGTLTAPPPGPGGLKAERLPKVADRRDGW
jgi:hypothetical protein